MLTSQTESKISLKVNMQQVFFGQELQTGTWKGLGLFCREAIAYKGRPISFLMKFYLILHFPNTVVQQPSYHFRNIEVESNDDRHFECFDALGPGRGIKK